MSPPSVLFSSVFLYPVVCFREKKGEVPLLGEHRLKDGRVSDLDLPPRGSAFSDAIRNGFSREDLAWKRVRGCVVASKNTRAIIDQA